MKILILEDHPGIYILLETLLKEVSDSPEIDHYTSLENALAAMESNPPDFVITDIQIGEHKQLDTLELCSREKIPYMVFSSYINSTILKHCQEHHARVVVSKSAPVEDLKAGVKNLIHGSYFMCSVCSNIENMKSRISQEVPKVLYTPAEEYVILAQIEGKSTVQLSQETRKSKYTIRNQRMHLMEKNGCTMEEIARRYLFWHTNG
jgi:DNA-binding NarL/FixJ family response regulator